MKFRALIPLFGQKAGIPDLALDESGGASLLFDDEHEISFTADEADGSVLFCCALGEIGRAHV